LRGISHQVNTTHSHCSCCVSCTSYSRFLL